MASGRDTQGSSDVFVIKKKLGSIWMDGKRFGLR